MLLVALQWMCYAPHVLFWDMNLTWCDNGGCAVFHVHVSPWRALDACGMFHRQLGWMSNSSPWGFPCDWHGDCPLQTHTYLLPISPASILLQVRVLWGSAMRINYSGTWKRRCGRTFELLQGWGFTRFCHACYPCLYLEEKLWQKVYASQRMC